MKNPVKELDKANNAIEHSINHLEFEGRGPVSRDVIGNVRHLVEHVAMCVAHGDTFIQGDYYTKVKAAIKQMKMRKDTRFIADFHFFLQKVVSHYVPTEDSAERLFLKYRENLLLLRQFANDRFGIRILSNLDKIPLDTDPGLERYHEEIAQWVDHFMCALSVNLSNDRFYVRSAKPFFVNERVYYETTLVPAYDSSSKFDHVLVFSSFRMPTNNAVKVSLKHTSIRGLGSAGSILPVAVVDDYEVSIRPCEINSLLKVMGRSDIARISGNYSSYRSLMSFMTRTGMSLYEISVLQDSYYAQVMNEIERNGPDCPVHILFDAAHAFFNSNATGRNVLAYLFSKPRNRVIKDQLADASNSMLGGLYLKNGCIPFERQPYCTSLLRHEIAVDDLCHCIDPGLYEDNLLARWVSQESLRTRSLYVEDSHLNGLSDVDDLIKRYNGTLYKGHASRQIEHEMGHLFVKGDEDDVATILQGLLRLSERGVKGYASMCDAWLAENQGVVDDPAKADALRKIFANTRVALVYGSAGTGKTTMINHVCSLLGDLTKVAIANTNPAVDSLRRKIKGNGCAFSTVAKYIAHPHNCDLLIVDECSTVCNLDMRQIVETGAFKLLMLVGDERQIESIRFGNWFSLGREFLPSKCVYEFEKPWRTTDSDLLSLWNAVRNMKSDIAEILASCDMSARLDGSVLERLSDDEIVLCLNYDGLYGINNLNRLLQSLNNNVPVFWNMHAYKVGDPILFNETERFQPLLYNNLKGRIVGIDGSAKDSITFTVAVEMVVSELSVARYRGLEFLDTLDGETYLRFKVMKSKDQDGEDLGEDCVVPFQVAYAVSVHKAQGLEYSSVKLVITKDVEKRITHSIFYTAITRARENLRIYWSPESQEKILSSFELTSSRTDSRLLSNRRGLKLHP